MKQILPLLVICLLSLGTMAATSSNPSALQLRLVLDYRTGTSEEMTLVKPSQYHAPPEVLNVQKTVLLDQTAVKSATVKVNNLGIAVIAIKFTETGAKQLAAVTRDNVGKRLAVVVEGKLYSAPRIATEITGGTAEITGSFTRQQAQDLATKINGAPVAVSEALSAGRIIFYTIALMFLAAVAVATWILIRRERAPSAA